jgi:hypothetical protein
MMRATPLRVVTLICVGLTALTIGSVARAKLTANGASAVRVQLKPVNGYHQSGVAVLTPTRKGFVVTVQITHGHALDGEHAHIHNISCARYAKIAPHSHAPTATQTNRQLATVAVSMNDLVNGKSVTSASEPLAPYLRGGYSINVHIPGAPFTAVMCGNIPKQT